MAEAKRSICLNWQGHLWGGTLQEWNLKDESDQHLWTPTLPGVEPEGWKWPVSVDTNLTRSGTWKMKVTSICGHQPYQEWNLKDESDQCRRTPTLPGVEPEGWKWPVSVDTNLTRRGTWRMKVTSVCGHQPYQEWNLKDESDQCLWTPTLPGVEPEGWKWPVSVDTNLTRRGTWRMKVTSVCGHQPCQEWNLKDESDQCLWTPTLPGEEPEEWKWPVSADNNLTRVNEETGTRNANPNSAGLKAYFTERSWERSTDFVQCLEKIFHIAMERTHQYRDTGSYNIRFEQED